MREELKNNQNNKEVVHIPYSDIWELSQNAVDSAHRIALSVAGLVAFVTNVLWNSVSFGVLYALLEWIAFREVDWAFVIMFSLMFKTLDTFVFDGISMSKTNFVEAFGKYKYKTPEAPSFWMKVLNFVISIFVVMFITTM